MNINAIYSNGEGTFTTVICKVVGYKHTDNGDYRMCLVDEVEKTYLEEAYQLATRLTRLITPKKVIETRPRVAVFIDNEQNIVRRCLFGKDYQFANLEEAAQYFDYTLEV